VTHRSPLPQAVGRNGGGPPAPLYRRTLWIRSGPWQPWITRKTLGNTDAVVGSTGTRLVWVNELLLDFAASNLSEEHLSAGGSTSPRVNWLIVPWLRRSNLGRGAGGGGGGGGGGGVLQDKAGVQPRAPEMMHFFQGCLSPWRANRAWLVIKFPSRASSDRLAHSACTARLCLSRIKQILWRLSTQPVGTGCANSLSSFVF